MRLPCDPLHMTSYRIPINSLLLCQNSIYTPCEGSHPTPHSHSNLLLHHLHHHHYLPRISLPHHPRIIMSGNSNSFSRTNPKETFNPADSFRGQTRPEHHLHRDSEPLPGNNSTAYGQNQLKDTLWENKRDNGTSPNWRRASSYSF